MKRKPLKISWRSWCLYKLARRDYSTFEIRQAIRKRARESEQQVDPEPVIKELMKEGILDDERFLKNKIRFYTETTYRNGPIKLREELQKKAGISSQLLSQYLDDDDPRWYQAAKKNSQKMLLESGLDPESPQRISDKVYFKIKRSLYSKGFTKEQIDSALNGLSPFQERKTPRPPGNLEKAVASRMASGKGPYDIRQFLLQKGVPKSDIGNLLNYPEEVWIEIAVRERQKRFGETEPKTRKEGKRQADFLQRRGFSFEQIKTALKGD